MDRRWDTVLLQYPLRKDLAMAKRPVTTDAYRHFGAYERLRNTLLTDPKHERMDRTLAYWVQPADRRLPVTFLDWKLGDILACSLDELMETPGVGQKKIGGLLTLLKRAIRSPSEDGDFGLVSAGQKRRQKRTKRAGFDPALVSEELWSHWRDTVQRCDISEYPLGRLAPTLQALPTVVWDTPLKRYIDLTLEDIRSLKTHGEKRVHAILEVFCGVHEVLATSTLQDHVEIVLVPKFAPPLAEWISDQLISEAVPSAEVLHENIAGPMVRQVQIDLGKQVGKLAATRVSLSPNAPTVRTQAKRMDVTRARVYQLLEDCAKVMQVRWPEGRWLIAALGSRLALADDVEALGQYRSIRDLFYPQERSAPVEQIAVETV